MSRKPIFEEIARLVNLLGNGVYLVYVHRHFDRTYNGKMKLMVSENGYVDAIGKYGREDWDLEWRVLETMDARHLLRIRNALMRDYGKRVLRGKLEIVPKQ